MQPVNLTSALNDLRAERRPLIVLVWCAIALTLTEYLFLPSSFGKLFPETLSRLAPGLVAGSATGAAGAGAAPWWGVLLPWAWWSGGLLVLWVAIPMAIARWQGYGLGALGLTFKGAFSKWPVYLLLLALVSPAVAWAASQPSFLATYPFLRPQYTPHWGWGVLLSYWLLYSLQFFAVEFFFRGWLLFTLEKRMGLAAIAVMVVPYCMIHFHKPLPEALGAIIAGVVLGWMALKTRSIWGGVCVHVAVAIGMDALSLAQSGGFP